MLSIEELTRDQKQKLLSLAAIRVKEQRKFGIVSTNKYAQYEHDSVGFINNVLGESLWSKQREICEAVDKYDRVAVKSCHSSGKSFVAARLVSWWISGHKLGTAFVVTSAPTSAQVRAILWREIGRAHEKGKLPGRTTQVEWKIPSTTIKNSDELVAIGRKPEDASPTAFQGYHAEHLLVVLDEACGVPSSLWTAAESLASNEGAKIFAIGNPDSPHTEFGEICKPGSGWYIITINAYNSPNLTGEEVPDHVRRVLVSKDWVEGRRKRWGENNPLYLSKVLGEFPEDEPDALIKSSWVTAAVQRTLEPGLPNELGVDVARSDRNNETVIFHRRGQVFRLFKAFYTRDLMRVVGEIVTAVRETGATRIKLDDIGIGGGVTDRLGELASEPGHSMNGVEVVPVRVSNIPLDQIGIERFKNQRSQLAWALRDRFQEGAIDLDDDEDTQAQICTIMYGCDSRGRVVVESKEEIAKRLSKLDMEQTESNSPDRFDALVLANAEIKPPSTQFLWSAADLYVPAV